MVINEKVMMNQGYAALILTLILHLHLFCLFTGVLILVYCFAEKILEKSKHEHIKPSDFQWKFEPRTTLPLIFIGSFTLSYLIIYCVCKKTDKRRIERETEIRMKEIRQGRGSLPRGSYSDVFLTKSRSKLSSIGGEGDLNVTKPKSILSTSRSKLGSMGGSGEGESMLSVSRTRLAGTSGGSESMLNKSRNRPGFGISREGDVSISVSRSRLSRLGTSGDFEVIHGKSKRKLSSLGGSGEGDAILTKAKGKLSGLGTSRDGESIRKSSSEAVLSRTRGKLASMGASAESETSAIIHN